MGKLYQLIVMACAMVATAGCSSDFDSVRETWRLTYDDYHVLVLPSDQILPEYRNITRDVEVLRTENELSIKGIIAEYPDAWTKFTIQGDTLCCEQGQSLEESENPNIYIMNPVRFYWGSCYRVFNWGITFIEEGIQFATYDGDGKQLRISSDGNIIQFDEESDYIGAFWFKKQDINTDEYFNRLWTWPADIGGEATEAEGHGYPDVGYMVNIEFRKVR